MNFLKWIFSRKPYEIAGYSLTRNHDGDALLKYKGKVVGLCKELTK